MQLLIAMRRMSPILKHFSLCKQLLMLVSLLDGKFSLLCQLVNLVGRKLAFGSRDKLDLPWLQRNTQAVMNVVHRYSVQHFFCAHISDFMSSCLRTAVPLHDVDELKRRGKDYFARTANFSNFLEFCFSIFARTLHKNVLLFAETQKSVP